MPRTKKVTVAGKEFVVTERKIKELEALAVGLSGSLDAVLKADSSKDAMEEVTGILYKHIPEIFPGVTKEDVQEAYLSEIEELGNAFIELHFFALKRLLPGLMALVQAGTKGKM
jgi:hypothetical protein